jgi:hypothetical protein
MQSNNPSSIKESTHMNPRKTTIAILAALFVSLALADDIKTINGKEYKNATVTRVEPDGITVKFSRGLVKIPFTEISGELKEKYHYNPEAAQKFAADSVAQINAQNAHNAVPTAKTRTIKEEQELELRLQHIRIFAIMKPSSYGRQDTSGTMQIYEKYWKGPTAYDFDWREVGKPFTGVLDQAMPEYFERGDVTPVIMYKIGHTDDRSRDPLFTMDREKAIRLLLDDSVK